MQSRITHVQLYSVHFIVLVSRIAAMAPKVPQKQNLVLMASICMSMSITADHVTKPDQTICLEHLD